MAKKSSLVGTRSTASQTSSPKGNVRDDVEVVPTKISPRPSDGRGIKGEGRPSSLLDTRVVYCGDNLEQLAKLPDACVDLIYIDPPFNSNRNYGQSLTGTVWGETREKRAFEDRHENTKAYIDYMRPRCVQLARVLKQTGSFYYHCDWHSDVSKIICEKELI
jgi:hypothetical protein